MFVYMMNAPHKDVPAKPSKFYLDGILEGCKDNQIPTESVMEAVKRTRQEVKKEKNRYEKRVEDKERMQKSQEVR